MRYNLESTGLAAERAHEAIEAWKSAGRPATGALIEAMRNACADLNDAEAYDETWS